MSRGGGDSHYEWARIGEQVTPERLHHPNHEILEAVPIVRVRKYIPEYLESLILFVPSLMGLTLLLGNRAHG